MVSRKSKHPSRLNLVCLLDYEAAKKAADSAEAAAIAAEAVFICAQAASIAVKSHALDAIALRRRFSSMHGFPGTNEAAGAKEADDRHQQRLQDGCKFVHGDSQPERVLAKAVALRQIVRDGGHYAPRFHGGTGPSDADGGAFNGGTGPLDANGGACGGSGGVSGV